MNFWRIAAASSAMLLLVAAEGAGRAGGTPSRKTILTFSGPVALPGVSLSPGSYTFEIADPDAGGDAVVVKELTRAQIVYMGLTAAVRRPPNVTTRSLVTFGTAPPGWPRPITAWYPSGELWGRRFLYEGR